MTASSHMKSQTFEKSKLIQRFDAVDLCLIFVVVVVIIFLFNVFHSVEF